MIIYSWKMGRGRQHQVHWKRWEAFLNPIGISRGLHPCWGLRPTGRTRSSDPYSRWVVLTLGGRADVYCPKRQEGWQNKLFPWTLSTKIPWPTPTACPFCQHGRMNQSHWSEMVSQIAYILFSYLLLQQLISTFFFALGQAFLSDLLVLLCFSESRLLLEVTYAYPKIIVMENMLVKKKLQH